MKTIIVGVDEINLIPENDAERAIINHIYDNRGMSNKNLMKIAVQKVNIVTPPDENERFILNLIFPPQELT